MYLYIFLAVCCVVGVQKRNFNVIRSKRPVARAVRDTKVFSRKNIHIGIKMFRSLNELRNT